MFLYLGKEMPVYHDLEKKMITIFQKLLIKEKNEKNS